MRASLLYVGAILACIISACLISTNAESAVYKCTGPNGVIYSDQPCGVNAKVIVPDSSSKPSSSKPSSSISKKKPAPSSTEQLDWVKICGTDNKEACIAAHRRSEAFERDFGARKMDSALPIQLLLSLQSTCRQNDPPALFSLHTKRVQKLILSEDPTRQRQIFTRYCGQLRALLTGIKGSNPANADYYMTEAPAARTGETKSILCIVPSSAAKPTCDLQLDVAVEDDELKKDKL